MRIKITNYYWQLNGNVYWFNTWEEAHQDMINTFAELGMLIMAKHEMVQTKEVVIEFEEESL